ncbi:MAG: antibiotic biosynthesis monooxygenase [Actinomycetota bacterium]
MVELLTQPPPPDVIGRMLAIEGVQVVPTMLATQQGPDRHLGPEAAGAILVLQATFADPDRAAGFWRTAAGLMERLATAPGFIRRYNLSDGPHYTLVAFWHTAADAQAFFASDEHQEAMRLLSENRWQYSHFAGLWECGTPRQRVIFCPDCDAVTPATSGTCGGCGTALFDPYGALAPAPAPAG